MHRHSCATVRSSCCPKIFTSLMAHLVGLHTRCLAHLVCCTPGVLVSAGGFEPPVSCFQGRRGQPASPTHCRLKVEHTAGLEPASSFPLPWSCFVGRG